MKRENFPLLRVEETLAMLEGSRVFSKMDASSGFWQIGPKNKSRELMMVITPFGRLQFRKMPFGVSGAPEFFQRQMDKTLRGLEGVICTMDDVLVFAWSEQEHEEKLQATLERLVEASLTLNRDKCEFGGRL